MNKTDRTKAYLTIMAGLEKTAAEYPEEIQEYLEDIKPLLYQVLLDGARLSFCDYEDCDETVSKDGEMCAHHANGEAKP